MRDDDKMNTNSTKEIKLAVLSCSYNRKLKTARFLTSLVNQQIPENSTMDVYLLDDNSPDGTADHVEAEFPSVRLVNGSGSLFWAGGMRTLWQHVLNQEQYDYYLLCNDDVMLFDGAVARLLLAYGLTKRPGNIILGTVQDSEGSAITYGGQKIINKILLIRVLYFIIRFVYQSCCS